MSVWRPVRAARAAADRLTEILEQQRALRESTEALQASTEALHASTDRLAASLHDVRAQVGGARADLDSLEQRRAAMQEELKHEVRHHAEYLHKDIERRYDLTVEALARQQELLRVVAEGEPGNRRRLWALRETPDYLRAFETEEPLVSVFITTRSNAEALAERSIPAVLAQTYENFELIVVGDAAGPEVEEAVRSFDDPRVRFVNLPMRGPYPDDPAELWFVAGSAPANEGLRLARGDWIAPNCDDDAYRPDHLELLLAEARRSRLELVYGRALRHTPEGETQLLGSFPPQAYNWGVQQALVHSGLRFVHYELFAATLRVPGDWAWVRRLMRIGVRMGMIDDVVVDYFPSQLFGTPDRTPGELT